MPQTTALALAQLQALLVNPASGVNARMPAIEARDSVVMPRIPNEQVFLLNLPAEVADANLDTEYPAILLFAEDAHNDNREKFAWFSGTLGLTLDVRISSERPNGLEAAVHRYVEAVIDVLQDSQGAWSPGLMYSGQYSVRYLPARPGGDNFLQSAGIALTLEQHVSF